MPQRVSALAVVLVGVIGLGVVLALILLGVNVQEQSRRGPAWRRTLIGLGLTALAMLGVSSCTESTATVPSLQHASTTTAPTDLAHAPQWARLVEIWHQAEDEAAGRLGRFHLDNAHKSALLARLDSLPADIDNLDKLKLLEDAEAKVLRMSLSELRTRVQAVRIAENAFTGTQEGYEAANAKEPNLHAQRLEARLTLLERLAKSPLLQREADWLLDMVRTDIYMTLPFVECAPLQEYRRRKELFDNASAVLGDIERQKHLDSRDLVTRPEWQRLTTTWKAWQKKLNETGIVDLEELRQTPPLDMKVVRKDLDSLRTGKLLSATECELAVHEFSQLPGLLEAKVKEQVRTATPATEATESASTTQPAESRYDSERKARLKTYLDAEEYLKARQQVFRQLSSQPNVRPEIADLILPQVWAAIELLDHGRRNEPSSGGSGIFNTPDEEQESQRLQKIERQKEEWKSLGKRWKKVIDNSREIVTRLHTIRPSDGSTLTNTPQWKRIAKAWTDGQAMVSNRRGPYPFNEYGSSLIHGQFAAAKADLAGLRQAGLLTAPEAELLEKELAAFEDSTGMASEGYRATCYDAGGRIYVHGFSVENVQARLDLLQNMARLDLKLEVVSRVIYTLELELMEEIPPVRQAEGADATKALEERDKALYAREAAIKTLSKIKERLLTEAPLAQTPQWLAIDRVWREGLPLAVSGKSTQAQRRKIDLRLDQAALAVAELVASDRLSSNEAASLQEELVNIRSNIFRHRPTDYTGAYYEDPGNYGYTPFESVERIVQRIQSETDGRLGPDANNNAFGRPEGLYRPEVMEMIFQSIKADLEILQQREDFNMLAAHIYCGGYAVSTSERFPDPAAILAKLQEFMDRAKQARKEKRSWGS